MKLHFIAIGGSAMHNLAIALKKKGYDISGSDDEIFEPSRGRLEKYGLLPEKSGWNVDRITEDLDGIILGMHARKDNPELLKAQKLGLKIYSYPEYLYAESKNKKQIVIAGSHGKTTITSMILHVLKSLDKDFDYLVGAQIEGFETMVSLSDAPIIIIEGDEYLSSPIDLKSKFLWYKPHVAVITGIAWDHINVFPTFEDYKKQFASFVDSFEADGMLIYYQNDLNLVEIVHQNGKKLNTVPYDTLSYEIENEEVWVRNVGKLYKVGVFGKHNLQNINAARLVCNQIGIEDEAFFENIKSFKGAAKRLELIAENEHIKIYKDFAHAPSKLKATIAAVKELHSDKKLIACLELHTFSSLNKDFLPQYKDSMNLADKGFVYFNPHTIEHKGLEAISKEQVLAAFNNNKLTIFNDTRKCFEALENEVKNDVVILLMSSGNFDGQNLNDWAKKQAKN